MKEAQGFLFNVFMSQGQEVFLNIQTHSEKSKLYHSGLVRLGIVCGKQKKQPSGGFLDFYRTEMKGISWNDGTF